MGSVNQALGKVPRTGGSDHLTGLKSLRALCDSPPFAFTNFVNRRA
jgi:hypothetical protein